MPSGEHSQSKIDTTNYVRLKLSEFDDRGCDRLVQAIVEKAVEDFVWGYRTEQKHPENGPSLLREQAERFFRSSWFEALTGLDGRIMLEGLKRQVKRDCRRRTISRPSGQRSASSG